MKKTGREVSEERKERKKKKELSRESCSITSKNGEQSEVVGDMEDSLNGYVV